MAKTNPKLYKMSASSISSFKACPTRFRLAYREGLRADTDTEAQRVGTNWHAIHEVYRNAYTEAVSVTEEQRKDHAMSEVIEHLNQRYDKVPSWTTAEDWDRERQVLLTSFIGYLWYYGEDTMQYVSQEIPFTLPVMCPPVGMNLPIEEVVRVGKIDHLINWEGMVGVLERKSTTRDIDPSSDYWSRSKKDTQVSMYALAVQDLFKNGELPLGGIDYERLGNTLYDVWRRPTIRPKALTQADSKQFFEDGKYMGQIFEIICKGECRVDGGVEGVSIGPGQVWVEGVEAELKAGKKGVALKETVSMFAARLLDDITERPAHYFQRKEIVRSQKELDKFRSELYNLYVAQKNYAKTDSWYENENQCEATFKCQYIPICYGAGADAVCDGKTTPPGFKRIFVDLTIEGQQNAEGAE